MPRTYREQDIIRLVHDVGSVIDQISLLAETQPDRANNLWKMMLQRVPSAVLEAHLAEVQADADALKTPGERR